MSQMAGKIPFISGCVVLFCFFNLDRLVFTLQMTIASASIRGRVSLLPRVTSQSGNGQMSVTLRALQRFKTQTGEINVAFVPPWGAVLVASCG